MATKVSYAVKIDPEIKRQLKVYCDTHGVKQGYFIEHALQSELERAEWLEDAAEFVRLKDQEHAAIPVALYKARRRARR